MKTSRVRFECPRCGGRTLQETVRDVVQHSDVESVVFEGGESVHLTYGDVDFLTDSGIDCFSCMSCGFSPSGETGVTIDNELDLMVWLQERGMLKEMSKSNGHLRLMRDGESRSFNLTYWDLLEWLKKQPPSLLKSQDVTILDAEMEEFIPVTRYDKTINSLGVLDDPHLILVISDEFLG